jgi:ferredoxin--NADP+ reductase
MNEHNATVTGREDLNGISILRMTPDEPRSFQAGQHLEVRFHGERRYYSIASAPSDPFIEIYATYDGTDAIWPSLNERVFLGQPSGALVLEHAPVDALLVLLATGTGIAPFASMVREGLGTRRAVLFHGVRQENDLGYRALFEKALGPRYVPIVSREPTFAGRQGRLQHVLTDFELIAGEPLSPARSHAYVCGSRDMVLAMDALLVSQGFTLGRNLHYERG